MTSLSQLGLNNLPPFGKGSELVKKASSHSSILKRTNVEIATGTQSEKRQSFLKEKGWLNKDKKVETAT